MLFVLMGHDSANAPELRRQFLSAHLEWVVGVMEHIRVAGPVADEQGQPCMSLYIVDSATESEARALIETDPYFRCGVWRELIVRPFVAAAGTWVGGANW
jgi:uncharacterized protein YciI